MKEWLYEKLFINVGVVNRYILEIGKLKMVLFYIYLLKY